MGHEHHFLSRLDRVSLPHVELALELYRDHERMRFLLRDADLPEGAERVAISLADPRQGPFLVVTREGRFVTCLGEGMHPGGLPVITRTQVDGATLRRAAFLASHEERERVGAAKGGVRALFTRIFTAGDELTSEDIQTLAAFQPLLAVQFLKSYLDVTKETTFLMPRVVSLLRRTDRPKPQAYPHLQLFWQSLWSIGHLAILGSMGGPTVFASCPDLPESTALPLARGTMFSGVSRVAQMGLWSIAKLGKSVLGTFKQAHDTASDAQRLIEASMALAVLGLRHGRLLAEVRKALSPSPPKGRPGLADYAKALSANLHRILDDPAPFTAIQRRTGARFAVRLSRDFPGTLPPFETEEDVPEDLALRLSIHDNRSYRHDDRTLGYLLTCLPWLARTSPESLYFPADLARATRSPWKPEHTIQIMRPWVESENARPRPRPEGPPRQGPCPCGSGKKYKRCCAQVSSA